MTDKDADRNRRYRNDQSKPGDLPWEARKALQAAKKAKTEIDANKARRKAQGLPKTRGLFAD